MNYALFIFNISLISLNVYSLLIIYWIYEERKKRFNKYVSDTLEMVKPRIMRECLALEEYCYICNGNSYKPAPIHHSLISVHKDCKERLEKGEVQVKEVGTTLNNETINVYKKMLNYLPESETKKLETTFPWKKGTFKRTE